MKTSSLFSSVLIALGSQLSTASETSPVEALLHFPNGDVLEGAPNGFDKDGFLLWKSDLFQNGQERFQIQSSDSLSFKGVSSQTPLQSGNATLARIYFQPHIEESIDSIEAELIAFDEESVHVKTWYAGDLILKRSMLSEIKVDGKDAPLINGPGSLDDWNQIGQGAWKIDSGNLQCSQKGSIAREFNNFPDKVHLSFDLESESTPFLRLFFFANSGTEFIPRESYSIQISGSQMYFLKRVGNVRIPLETEIMGGRHIFNRNSSQKVDLYADRKNGLLALYIDDDEVAIARDKNPLTEGDWWHFNTTNSRVQKLKNFTIRPWDGQLPEKASFLEFRDDLEGEGQVIELQNGDTVLGTAQKIEEGKLRIETEFMPIAVPIERLKSFEVTPKDEGEGPRIYPEDVRAYFATGGFISLKLSEITPTSISGYSQVFGDATFDLRAFTHIHFNPYDEEFRERRGESL